VNTLAPDGCISGSCEVHCGDSACHKVAEEDDYKMKTFSKKEKRLIYNEIAINEHGLSYDVTVPSSTSMPIYLNRLDVEPEFRFKGLATKFLQNLIEVADKHGLEIELEVGSGTDEEDTIDDLPAFYMKFGFKWEEGFMRRIYDQR
jgi:GNAT superfamily N-acetyltransferase